MTEHTTIAAIATAQAAGGIGVIRVSGPGAHAATARVFRPASGADVTTSKGYRAHYGTVIDPQSGQRIDEAVCLIFRSPHSYTGEDAAELSVHGGLFVTQRVLRALLAAGCSPAQPGEFTKRAFLNGRLDLTQAEAVMALITAQGEDAAQSALTALEGALQEKMHAMVQLLLADCAQLAAWVDYPDEDIEELQEGNLLPHLEECSTGLQALLDGFSAGKTVSEGVDTVIVGRPNVGKSTLMNLLSGYDRSIVTDIPGTTRDIVEETVQLGNVTLRIADTAGLRSADNPVEQIGVEWAKKRLERAQLVLAVFDSSQELREEDWELLQSCRGKTSLAIVNKSDLPARIDSGKLREYTMMLVQISAKSGDGLAQLTAAVTQLLGTRDFDPGAARLATERQYACCRAAQSEIHEAILALGSGVTLDAVTVLMENAVDYLLELTGQKASEAVVDEIFSRFCVGK